MIHDSTLLLSSAKRTQPCGDTQHSHILTAGITIDMTTSLQQVEVSYQMCLQSRALVCSFYIYLSNPLSSVFGWSTLKHLPIIFLLVTSELSHTGEFLCGSAWNNRTEVPQKCNCTDMPLYRFQNNYNAQYLHNTFCECLTHYSQSAFNNCRDIKL